MSIILESTKCLLDKLCQTWFGENPFMFTQVIIWKQKMDGWRDRHMDVQCETIIPRHYRVAGYI